MLKNSASRSNIQSLPRTLLPDKHRITKSTNDRHKRKRGSGGVSLNDRFQDTIEAYRDELGSEVRHQLSQTEKGLEDQLANITSEFSGKLKVVATYEEEIFRPVAQERLEITTRSPSKSGHLRKQQATLAERIAEFDKILAEESAHLEVLWKEWYETQLELVCLAVEVLGPEGVKLEQKQHHGQTTAQVKAAVDAHRGREASRADTASQIAKLGKSIRKTADETIRTLDEHEKEWKANEKKKIQRIKQIMMEVD